MTGTHGGAVATGKPPPQPPPPRSPSRSTRAHTSRQAAVGSPAASARVTPQLPHAQRLRPACPCPLPGPSQPCSLHGPHTSEAGASVFLCLTYLTEPTVLSFAPVVTKGATPCSLRCTLLHRPDTHILNSMWKHRPLSEQTLCVPQGLGGELCRHGAHPPFCHPLCRPFC